MTKSALVLLSGGQDSTVCLAWALENHDRVETVGFDYGQRHGVEMQCRTQILQRLRQVHPSWTDRLQDDHLLDLTTFGQIGETAMTHDVEISATESGLPNTFVPGRNLLFFTYAAAIAYRRGINTLVGGMCETDYSGYPDCRDKTIQALAEVITLGMDYDMKIATPLMWLDKAATWAMADQIGGPELVSLIVEDTHTCYLGSREQRHEWGYGCGTCPACQLRARGWHSWRSS